MLTDVHVHVNKEDDSTDEEEEELPQSLSGPPRSFWELLESTVRAREQQAEELNLEDDQPRSAIAPELEPFVNSTRWPHDNSPLPEYIVHLARPRPTQFEPYLDDRNQWAFYKLDAGGRCTLSVMCCVCFLVPVMTVALWMVSWCPLEVETVHIATPDVLQVRCSAVHMEGPVNSTLECFSASTVAAPPDDQIASVEFHEARCSRHVRFAVFSILLLLLGCPGIFCLISALEPLLDNAYYYFWPLNRQLYVNYPEVWDGHGPLQRWGSETRLVNHLRALTLLYTVDKLSRMPAPSVRCAFFRRILWPFRSMYHFQWAKSHHEWVLRVHVLPDGSVDWSEEDRYIGAADECGDMLYDCFDWCGVCGICGLG